MDDIAARSRELLESGVPLSLLLDLALGPDNEDKLREERALAALSRAASWVTPTSGRRTTCW